jgi:hypothetical protein
MGRFLMRDEDGNVCPRCGGTGLLQNVATFSPSDANPCPCTYEDDEDEEDRRDAGGGA